jgi:cob(I)alamin adenosyltransferase
MKIYTKRGDTGETGLFGGTRVSKSHTRIRAIGDVDELNAALGVARAVGAPEPLDRELQRIQNWLFGAGAELASPGRSEHRAPLDSWTLKLEESIDRLEAELTPLRNFILPGGSLQSAHLHLARCICRRAERSVLDLHAEEPVREEILAFLNRLSDWMFVAARSANRLTDRPDVLWISEESTS